MRILTIILFFFANIIVTCAQTNSGYTVADEGAWCWFADPRAIHYQNESGTINMTYIGYIDVHGAIKATQYNWYTGEKSDVLVRSYFQPDDHNNPTFLVLPDERVLIIYSRHTDEAAFYYRVSTKPGDITSLGEEKRLATANNTTYPSPFIMSDDPTHWYLCWRGISWHPTIARLTLPDANDNVKFDWGPYQMVQSTGARPYAKYFSNGKDKLYVAYTTGHPDNESPNWLYFNVININGGGEPTLEDIKGNKLSTIKNGSFKVSKTDTYKNSYPYTVVDAPSNGIRDWVWQIALDKQDKPRIAMVRINSAKTQHEYYYARWTGSSWSLIDICDGGGKFHPSNTEYCYSGGEALDPQNPNVMYVSRPTEGTYGKVYEIWKYTLNDNGQKTNEKQITLNSKKNNVRPYVIQNSQDSPLRLSWMNGDYQYWIVCKNYPSGFPTSIKCDYDFTLSTISKKGWTYNSALTLDGANYTNVQLASIGSLTYGVDSNAYPYVKIGSKTYRSQSKLYTSDAWQTCSATTDGKSYNSLLTQLYLTLSYDSEHHQLTVYRNGLIDQVIDVELSEMPVGTVDGCKSQQQIQQDMAFESGKVSREFVNRDFEDTYTVYSKPNSDRAIYQPKGWNIDYSMKDPYDLTALKSGDLYYSDFFASKPKPTEGGKQTLWIRQRWAASDLAYSQNVLLPKGDYTITALVYASTNKNNQTYIFADDVTAKPSSFNQWNKLTLTFHSDGKAPVLIGLKSSHTSDEFICGFDNFTLTREPSTILRGDVNSDGEVTIVDLVTLIYYLSGHTPDIFDYEAADVNGDNVIDISDVKAFPAKLFDVK